MKPTLGRIVHYVAGPAELTRAAIITWVRQDGAVNLTVFPYGGRDPYANPFTAEGIFESGGDTVLPDPIEGVRYDRGIWVWPPRE